MKNRFLLVLLSSIVLCSCNNSNKEMKNLEYSNNNISDSVSILRNKETKAISLDVKIKGNWILYSGNSVESINFSEPLLEGKDEGIYPISLSDSVRYYFQFETPTGKAILSETHLPMAGGYNFRDLGGITNTDGKHIRWGKIFRSDDLHNLTDKDLQYLSNIPLISVVDFRSDDEINKAPDKLPSSVKKDYSYSITPGNLMQIKNLVDLTPVQLDTIMMDMNILLVTDTTCINQYRNFFALLQNDENIPLMFHCSAGKDRTGMGTALVLYALGVDETIILDDYLLSNLYLEGKYAEYIAKYPNLKPLFEVKPEFLMAGIDRIKNDHKTVQNYLENVLGVDIQKMQDMYLY